MEKKIDYSIIIVTAKRKHLFGRCVESVKNEFKNTAFEIIAIFNHDLSYHEEYTETCSFKKITLTENHTPATARNFAIKISRGESLFFIDDDAYLPKNYFQQFIRIKNWDVLGGPDLPVPLQDNEKRSLEISKVLSSPLCMGKTSFRHRSGELIIYGANESLVSLCNLWIKKDLFALNENLFPDFLMRNEENFWLKKNKSKIKNFIVNQKMYVFHERRKTYKEFQRMIFQNGFYRSKNFLALPSLAETKYFFPLIVLLLSILILILFPKFFILCLILSAIAIAIYELIHYKTVSKSFIYLHFLVITSYAIGTMLGLIKKQI